MIGATVVNITMIIAARVAIVDVADAAVAVAEESGMGDMRIAIRAKHLSSTVATTPSMQTTVVMEVEPAGMTERGRYDHFHHPLIVDWRHTGLSPVRHEVLYPIVKIIVWQLVFMALQDKR